MSLAIMLFVVAIPHFISTSWFVYSLYAFFAFILLPVFLIKKNGGKLIEYNVGWGNWKHGLKLTVIACFFSLPFMLYGTSLASFQDYYPLWKSAENSVGEFIVFEMYVMYLMVWTEFLHRGFILTTLSKITKNANIWHAVIYMLVHIGKPWPEVIYSFFAGLVFGYSAQKTKSIMPSFLMHFSSSVVWDILIMYNKGIIF